MEYLLLIYNNEADMAKLGEAELGSMFQEFGQFTQSIQQSGNFQAGKQLQPVTTATTVRMRDGKRQVTDGPFAETREQLGGYFLIDVKNLDEAISIAERIPAGRWGTVEIRPVMEIGGLPAAKVSNA